METRIASKMDGKKRDKRQQQQQKHECKKDDGLTKWLGPNGDLVDFSDTAPSPCKDFYHVFVTPIEVCAICVVQARTGKQPLKLA